MTVQVDDTARDRAMALGKGVVQPIVRPVQMTVFGVAVAGFATLGVGVATGEPALGAASGVGVSLLTAMIAWAPLTAPDLRAAVELFFDHDCHERAEWRSETGTDMPRSVSDMKEWVERHPDSPGRASVLLPLGRLVEADEAIAAMTARTPEEAFGMDVLRQTRNLLADGTADTTSLHERWRSLPDPRERLHRRECLALLDGMLAVAADRDPVPVLAAARREVGEVHRSMRISWLLAKWGGMAALVVTAATMLSAVRFS